MKLFFYFLSTLIVIFSNLLITQRFKSKSVLERVLQVFLLVFSQIILSELFLGVVIRSLTSENLLLANSAIFMIACGIFLTGPKPLKDLKISNDLHPLFEMIKGSLFNKFLLGLMAVQISIILFIGTFFPPGVWDCWTYHLTSVAYWMQDQAIQIIDTAVLRSNIFPVNSELLNLWNVIFFKSDRIVSLTQLPFAFMGMIAVYGLGRKMGLNERKSLVASLLFFFTPLVVLQSSTAQNDLIFVGILLTGIYFAQSFTESLCLRDLLFSGISSGILMGTKGHGALFCFFLLGYILVGTMRKMNLCFLARIMFLYLILVVGLGGFSYFRNWIHFHNPFYPATIELMGVRIFSGDPTIWRIHYLKPGLSTLLENVGSLWQKWFEINNHFGRPEGAGYGPQWIILGLPSIIYTIIYYLKQRLKGESKCIIRPLLLILLSFIAFVFVRMPSPWNMRLTLFLPAGGAIATGLLFQHASYLHKALIKFIVLISILFVMVNSTVYNLYAPLSQFELVLSLPPSERTIGNLGPWPQKLEGYKMIDRLAQSGDAIGYMTHGDGWIYPLFGRHFERKVYNMGERSGEQFIALIKDRKIKYLILRRDVDPTIQKIIDQSPEIFLLKHEGENNVYEVTGQGSANLSHANGRRDD
jgi:hypothetical protein